MAWRCERMSAHPIIETAYVGLLDHAELEAAVRATIELAQRTGTLRFLADCSRLEGGHSIMALYGIANTLSASSAAHGMREALLLPALPKAAEDVRFWETVCRNRGLTVRIFEDRKAAMDWLLA